MTNKIPPVCMSTRVKYNPGVRGCSVSPIEWGGIHSLVMSYIQGGRALATVTEQLLMGCTKSAQQRGGGVNEQCGAKNNGSF